MASFGCRLRAAEVAAFKASWPCHGLTDVHTAWFGFASNGDLTDFKLYSERGRELSRKRYENSGAALAALAQDAWRAISPVAPQ